MSAFETDLLADLIRAKRACLTQLRDLGRKQMELIDLGEMAALLELLATKQRFISQLQRIERALDPFRGQDPQERRWRTPHERAQCGEQIQQCESLLREIIGQEKCSEGAMIRRRDEAAARLQGVHLAGRARGAYGPEPYSPACQLDLLSER